MSIKQEVSLREAGKAVTKSYEILDKGYSGYGRDTLRRFLWAVAAGVTTYDEIGTIVGITKSQISRAARTLHKQTAGGEPGLDLITIGFDLANPRIKVVRLSGRGKKLLAAEYKALCGITIVDEI